MSTNFDHIPVFDADNHFYEPIEALTRHLPAEHQGKVQLVQVGKRTRIALRGHITDYIPNPTFEVVSAPGSHADYYAGKNPNGLTLREMAGAPIRLTDDMRWPQARLDLMDRQRVEGTLMFATLANLVEYQVSDDPDLTHDLLHALNAWIDEVWTFDLNGRVYPAAAISCGLVDRAIAELEWVLERGAKAILLRPSPAVGYHGSRAISLPEFDPFWARVQEAGVAVCLHSTQPITAKYAEIWEPRASENAFSESVFRNLVMWHRDIQDALGGFICHGTLTRFPNLRIATIENGAEWVGEFQNKLSMLARRHPKAFLEDPVEQFRRNIYVCPFWEEDVRELVELCGEDRVMYGSDYPHPEGLAEPRQFLDALDGMDEVLVRKIVHDNVLDFVGV
ncbi:MAG: amidohydrolase family protein [Acidimicrobiia bacterium]